MATENIVTGKKFRICTDAVNKIYDRISFWTKASDVYNNSDKALETTCGSITGITSSLTSTSKTMAASASAIKQLNDKIADLNSNLSSNEISGTLTTKVGTSGFYPKSTNQFTGIKKGSVINFSILNGSGSCSVNGVNVNSNYEVTEDNSTVIFTAEGSTNRYGSISYSISL